MIVEHVEAFKTWLTAVLKPMCEADPAALAKYVLALIKKDKTEDELKKSMIAQLDVFLEAETESFVDLVFQTLATKDYVNVPIVPNANPPNPNMGKVKEPIKESKVIIQPSELPNLNEAVNGNAKKEQEIKRDRENRLENRKNSDSEKDKEKDKEKEREDRPPRPLRRSPVTVRHRSLSRNRSRSRSWDRTKRSRSREKSREREQHRVDREKRDRPRIWRNKSPPRIRYDRRRGAGSRTPSPPPLGRARSRSRSPRHSHRGRYRARGSASRSRSRSPDAKRDRRDSAKDKDATSRPGSPAQDSNHGDADARLGSAHSLPAGAGKKKRCRDFDEKGYCMSGDMCPFDHGIDPVVLEDAALSRVLTYNPNGGPAVGPRAPLHSVVPDNPYNPQAPQLWRDFRPGGPGGRAPPMGIARVPPLGVYPPPTNMNRELIPVPVMDNGAHKPPEGFPPMVGPPYRPPGVPPFPPHHEGYKKRGPFDFNRLGPVRHQQKNPQNCSLELKKVPNGLNTITHLNNHFGKFGKIVNIQVSYEGDPEAALITFSSHAEANAAYRCTEAVLNNRFIKVFWHNANPTQPDAKHQENVPPSMRSVKDRLGNQTPQAVPPNANKVFNLVQPKADDTSAPGVPGEEKPQDASSGDEKTKEENHTQAVEAIKKGQELLAAQAKVKKNQDVQRKQVLQIQSDLRKKKQELLDKQLSQQKILLEKMEKMPPGLARDLVKDTIKKTQEAIAAITKDLEAAALAASKAGAAKPKTKEEAQRELLDAELDLIAKQQEGADTKELQKKLNELRAKVAAAGAVRGGRVGRRYPMSTPVIGRHLLTKNNLKLKAMKTVNRPSPTSQTSTALSTTFQKHTVDHRPTKLLVSGYETDEQDSVLSHFQQYGEIADYEVDPSIPSITLNYKTRKEAEMALLKGKHFQDRTLSITWSTSKQLNRQRSSGSVSTRTVVMSETEEDQLIDSSILDGAEEDLGPEISEEALLQDDEEEEDEDRSWRR